MYLHLELEGDLFSLRILITISTYVRCPRDGVQFGGKKFLLVSAIDRCRVVFFFSFLIVFGR